MIKLNAVTKKLKNRKVLDEISVTFEEGKLYLLRGHNGSGKTMLLRLLCDLIAPKGNPAVLSVSKYKTFAAALTYFPIIQRNHLIKHRVFFRIKSMGRNDDNLILLHL